MCVTKEVLMPSNLRSKFKIIRLAGVLLSLSFGACAGMVQATVGVGAGAMNFGPGAAPLHIFGQDAATGYLYDGFVKDGAACGGGALAAGVFQICLTDFVVNRPLVDAHGNPTHRGGNLLFGFTESFPG